MNPIALLLDAAHQVASAQGVEYMDPAEVAEGFVELRAAVDRLEAQMARRLAAVDDRRGYARDGYSSSTAFVKHRCRISGGRAKRMIAEARALGEMHLTSKLLDAGELSHDQARALIRAREAEPQAFASSEAALCDIARELPWVPTLSKALAYWQQAVAEAPDAKAISLESQRYLYCSRTFEGMVKIDGLLAPEAGEAFLSALDEATPAPILGDVRTPAQRRADGLADLALGDSVPQVLVHVSHRTLEEKGVDLGEIGSGVLSPEVLRRLSCESALGRLVFGPESVPLDAGRSVRAVPAPMRRVVAARDRHCVFPGCDRPERWCDAHHIEHWADGGATSVENLALLCRHHHTLVHEGGFGMSGPASALVFARPDGSRLPP